MRSLWVSLDKRISIKINVKKRVLLTTTKINSLYAAIKQGSSHSKVLIVKKEKK